MHPMNREALAEQYRRLRAELLEAHPELAEDTTTLADTLEGETDLPDVVAKYIRAARDDEAMADALASMMKGMGERKTRLLDRAARRRAIAAAMMNTVGLRKLEQPDFTASVRMVPPKIIVTDETAIPDAYCRITKSPDKRAIGEAMLRGETVPGTTIGNGGITLLVRTN